MAQRVRDGQPDPLGGLGPCSASASGFAYNAIYSANNTGDAFDFEHCSVTAEEISCRSDSDGGYTAGFMFWGYGTYGDCSVDVTTLDSFGIEAATAGFTYDFSPIPLPTEAISTVKWTAARSAQPALPPPIPTPHTPPKSPDSLEPPLWR